MITASFGKEQVAEYSYDADTALWMRRSQGHMCWFSTRKPIADALCLRLLEDIKEKRAISVNGERLRPKNFFAMLLLFPTDGPRGAHEKEAMRLVEAMEEERQSSKVVNYFVQDHEISRQSWAGTLRYQFFTPLAVKILEDIEQGQEISIDGSPIALDSLVYLLSSARIIEGRCR